MHDGAMAWRHVASCCHRSAAHYNMHASGAHAAAPDANVSLQHCAYSSCNAFCAATPAASCHLQCVWRAAWLQSGLEDCLQQFRRPDLRFKGFSPSASCFPTVRVARAARLQSALEDRLAEIVRTVNAKREHIPPVVSAATVTFPFDISIAGCAGRTSWASKRYQIEGWNAAALQMFAKSSQPGLALCGEGCILSW